MQVLVALIQAGGQIVSRDELLASCWSGVVVGEDAIDRVMGRVRRLADGIGDGAFKLETITRVGYRLVTTGPAADLAPAAPTAAPKLSICVLPFANLSDDPQQEYFSDGICEDIITDLSKVSALSVVARRTAFTFKGKEIDARQVAGQLGVSHLLEGSVRRAGGRVRVTAQLIDGAAGNQIWAERWDRELTDIFALQDEVSQAIVGALKLQLLPEEKQAIERRGTDNVDAFNLYLLARQHLVSGNHGDVRDAEVVLRLCTRATDIDPNYARAWALMASAQTRMRTEGGRPEDGLEAAERALSLDPDLAEARTVRARHLYRVGRHDEAFAEIGAALALDPDSYEVNADAGLVCLRSNRPDDAIRYFEKAAALMESSFAELGMAVTCYRLKGDVESAHRAARMCLERCGRALMADPSNGRAIGFGVGALGALGEAERMNDWIARGLLIDPDNMNMRYNFACSLSAFFQDADGAIALLERYLETAGRGDLDFIKVDQDLDPVRDDPRFAAMLAAAEARESASG